MEIYFVFRMSCVGLSTNRYILQKHFPQKYMIVGQIVASISCSFFRVPSSGLRTFEQELQYLLQGSSREDCFPNISG